MNNKLPVIPVSKSSKNENKHPSGETKNPTRSRKEPSNSFPLKNLRPLPINCALSVEEMIKEAVNNLIHEYLLKMNFTETLEKFKDELRSSKPISIENYRENLRQHFKSGQKEKFFDLWNHFIPVSLRMHDKETIKTEFFTMLYFIFYKVNLAEKDKKVRQSNSRTESRDTTAKESITLNAFGVSYSNSLLAAVDEFRGYLIKNGEEFSKIDDLLPYYALPYLKEPFNHPLFKEVLTEAWVNSLSAKLDAVLNSLYSPKSKPYLLQMYEASFTANELNHKVSSDLVNDLCLTYKEPERTFPTEPESGKKRSFQSFKDKTKSPLMNVIGQKHVSNEFAPSDLVLLEKSPEKNQKRPQSQRQTPSPSKAIQVKQYIQRIEAENQKLNDKITLLSKKCEQNELRITDLHLEQKRVLGEANQVWKEQFDRFFEFSMALFQFGNMFRQGREVFLDTAQKKLSEFCKLTSNPERILDFLVTEKTASQNQDILEPHQPESQEIDTKELKANLVKHLAG